MFCQTIHAARCEQQQSYKERDRAWISKIAGLTQEATGGQAAAAIEATPRALTSWPLSSSSGWWPRQQGQQEQQQTQEQQQQARLQQAATQLYEGMKAELLSRARTSLVHENP